MNSPQHGTLVPMAISASERAFITRLGARVADMRKAQSITQVQMAEALNVSQQTINMQMLDTVRAQASRESSHQ